MGNSSYATPGEATLRPKQVRYQSHRPDKRNRWILLAILRPYLSGPQLSELYAVTYPEWCWVFRKHGENELWGRKARV